MVHRQHAVPVKHGAQTTVPAKHGAHTTVPVKHGAQTTLPVKRGAHTTVPVKYDTQAVLATCCTVDHATPLKDTGQQQSGR